MLTICSTAPGREILTPDFATLAHRAKDLLLKSFYAVRADASPD
jgi:hypothetical protein